jgi:hypothetical protein
MGGPTSAQQDLQASQSAFYKQLTSEYGTIFGESQGILTALTKSFSPILAKGPSQEGFSDAELNSLNSTAVSGTADNYAKAAAALSKQQAAEGGGGGPYIPSGAKMQQQDALATSAARTQSLEEGQIVQADWNQGLQNYWNAASGLGSTAAELNPNGAANAATGAGSAASQTAQEIAQESGSWMSLVGAGLGAAGTAAGGYFGKH